MTAIAGAAALLAGGDVALSQTRGAGAIATAVLGALPAAPVYWHLDRYPTRAAAEAARGERGTVVAAFDRVWLFTIAEESWRPSGGERVATIGPLPLEAGGHYTASYLQAATAPGFQTDVHRHAGPEALYTLSGEVCLETPRGKLVGRAGGKPLVVAGDQPMRLTSIGPTTRHSIVLVLHDSSQPWKVPASGWTPKGLCDSDS